MQILRRTATIGPLILRLPNFHSSAASNQPIKRRRVASSCAIGAFQWQFPWTLAYSLMGSRPSDRVVVAARRHAPSGADAADISAGRACVHWLSRSPGISLFGKNDHRLRSIGSPHTFSVSLTTCSVLFLQRPGPPRSLDGGVLRR